MSRDPREPRAAVSKRSTKLPVLYGDEGDREAARTLDHKDFDGQPITDALVLPIVRARPGLRFIDLSKTAITDESVKAIAELKELKRLDISRCKGITKASFVAVADGLVKDGNLKWFTFGFHRSLNLDIMDGMSHLACTVDEKYEGSDHTSCWGGRFGLDDLESPVPMDDY